ncbi:MAG TPA: HEAT repeat domain-containing protein, partial [Gemmataceae bacterium]|nr:HEAT repeat domain-containing protein [Gemmataceae bacterium]
RRLLYVSSRAAAAIPDLLVASRDESNEVRAYALLVLGGTDSDDPEVQRAARSGLFDPDPKVRAAAAVCLVRFKHPPEELLPALCDGMRQRGHQVAISSVGAIMDLGPAAESIVPVMRELALDTEHPDEAGVVYALGKVGPVGVPVLIEVLERGTTSCRTDAAYALGEMGEAARPAFPALRRAAKDPDQGLSGAANRALRRLGAEVG